MAAADLGVVRRWLSRHARVDGLVIEPRPTQQIHDTYLDTSDWRLYRAGFALRLRAASGKNEATLKAFKSARKDVADRIELSEPLRTGTPRALTRLHGPVGNRVHAVAGHQPLQALFEVRTHRQRFAVRQPNGGSDLGEIALDETVISRPAGAARATLHRVEVEALSDEHEPLERLVKVLRSECALENAGRSKFELGLKSMGLAPRTQEPAPVPIEGSMPAAEAARVSLRRLLAVWVAYEPAARLGDDPEALHALRVTARRMEAILTRYERYLPAALPRTRPKLKGLLRTLGAVRDLDLELAKLATFRKDLAQAESVMLEPLARYLQSRRTRSRGIMLRTLDAKTTAAWFEGIREALSESTGSPADTLQSVAPALIEDRFRKLRKAFRQLGEHPTMEEYHRARRQAKKLRYVIEPVAEIYGKAAQEILQTLRRLQDRLGAQHDAHIAMTRLADLANRPQAALPPPTVFLMGRLAEHGWDCTAEEQGKIQKTWRKLSGPRWKALRVAMEALHEAPTPSGSAGSESS